jgi:hypothetical protein
MSSYSNVTPRIIDPVFDRSNNRVEFRLPEGHVFLSSFRIINLGLTSAGSSTYNPILGALAAIKSITILDGATQLDTLKTAPILNAVKNINRRNDENLSMNRYLKSVNLGYLAYGEQGAVGNDFDPASLQINVEQPVAAKTGAKQGAWISLKDLLSFLDASLIVPTTTYRNLRIVIEYNNAAESKYLLTDTADTAVATLTDALLLVDEVNEGDMKEQLVRNYKGVVYRPLETEQVVVPEVSVTNDAPENSQTANFLVNGFNNKFLRRLMVVNQTSNPATWQQNNKLFGYGPLQSAAQWSESLQFRVNGQNKFPGRGVAPTDTGSAGNRRLAMLTDTWGDFNIFPGQQFTNIPDTANFLGATVNDRVGQQDLGSAEIMEHINELQVSVGRTGIFQNLETHEPINLLLVGEVEKAVTMSGDGYNVTYV